MTWGNILETGRGKVALRLQIEGMAFEWVTDSSIAGAGSHDRLRKVGLVGSTFTFSEQADIAGANLNAQGCSIGIVDVAEAATLDFASMPDQVTWITADITTAATTIQVLSTAGFVADQYIHIGTECMKIVSVDSAVQFTVTRARRSTIAQAFYSEDGENLRSPEVTDRPVSIEGRRAYIFAYGDDETGDGTQIWIGMCATEARLTGGTRWEITIDPIAKLFEQEVGKDLENAVKPRGVMYVRGNGIIGDPLVGCDLTVGCRLDSTSATRDVYFAGSDSFTFNLAETYGTDGVAFYETQEQFLTALNAAIVDASSGFATPLDGTGTNPSLRAVATASGGWELQFRAGTPARWAGIYAQSDIDYRSNERLMLAGVEIETVVAGLTYTVMRDNAMVDAPGTVPRGSFSGAASTRRIYIGGSLTVDSLLETATIEFPDFGGYAAESVACDIRTENTLNRWIGVSPASGAPTRHLWTQVALPSITFGREYTTGNIWDFLAAVMAASPTGANNGTSPLLISNVDVAAVSAEETIDALVEDSAFLAGRTYGQFKAMKLSEILAPELILMGAVMSTDSSGRVTFRAIRSLSPSEKLDGVIDPSVQLDFPSWERNAFGAVNTVVVPTGWDAREDTYNGRTFVVRDVGALSRNKVARRLTIEPKSYLNSDADAGVTETDILKLVTPLIGLLGYPYDVVTVAVPLTLFSAQIGDAVSLESDQIPGAETGTRGVSNKNGLVIGRRWSIMEGRGELTLLVTLQRVAGYTPTSRVISYTGTNPYTITITEASQPDGYSAITSWNNGDLVKIFNIDAAVPTTRTGTISNINVGAETFDITLSGAIPGGTLNIDYQAAGVVQDSQKIYAFAAGTDGRIGFSTELPARTLAP